MGVDAKELESVTRALVARGKGILAADESQPTMAKRLAARHLIGTERA
jgi:fructose-bisphosphate aldolase class 1